MTAEKQKTLRYDWERSPLPDAERRLEELRREYIHATAVMNQRRSAPQPTFTCWTQSMLDEKYEGTETPVISNMTRSQCRKTGPSGKWASRYDDHQDERGNRISVSCCSYLCNQDYLRWRGWAKSRKPNPQGAVSQTTTSEVSG